jgi:hypothetical protein
VCRLAYLCTDAASQDAAFHARFGASQVRKQLQRNTRRQLYRRDEGRHLPRIDGSASHRLHFRLR